MLQTVCTLPSKEVRKAFCCRSARSHTESIDGTGAKKDASYNGLSESASKRNAQHQEKTGLAEKNSRPVSASPQSYTANDNPEFSRIHRARRKEAVKSEVERHRLSTEGRSWNIRGE